MKLIKKSLIGLLFVGSLLVALLVVTLMTSQGTQRVLTTALQWVPGLTIVNIEGKLTDLSLKQVTYQQEGIRIEADQLHLVWQPTCLIKVTLCFNKVQVDHLFVEINSDLIATTPAVTPSAPITDVNTPLPIELKQLVLNHGQIRVNGIDITAHYLAGGATWQQRTISLLPTQIDQLKLTLPVEEAPTKKTAEQQPLGKQLQHIVETSLTEALPSIIIPVDVKVSSLTLTQSDIQQGDTHWQIDQLQLIGTLINNQITLEPLAIETPSAKVHVNGQFSFNKNWPIDLTLQAQSDQNPFADQRGTLILTGAIGGTLHTEAILTGSLNGKLLATVELDQKAFPFSLSLTSSNSRLPIDQATYYQLNQLNLQAQGKATDYRIDLQTALSGAQLPTTHLRIKGQGNYQQLTLAPLEISQLNGTATLTGMLNWFDAFTWQTTVKFNQFTLDSGLVDWPLKLDGSFTTHGQFNVDQWQFALTQLTLNGQLKQQPLSLSGKIQGNSAKQWRFDDVALNFADNHITINGTLAEKWQVDTKIEMNNLHQIEAQLGGSLVGNLKLRGTIRQPSLISDLQGSGITWQTLSIAQLGLNSTIAIDQYSVAQNLLDSHYQGQLHINLNQLTYNENSLRQLNLQVSGDKAQHQITLVVDGQPFAGKLTLNGTFKQALMAWQGVLHVDNIKTPVGQWYPNEPIKFAYQTKQTQWTISPHCWFNIHAQFCLTKMIASEQYHQLKVNLAQLDLAMFNPYLSNEVQLQGQLQGELSIAQSVTNPQPEGRLSLTGKDLKAIPSLQAKTFPITLETMNLIVELSKQQLTLNSLLKLRDNGTLKSHVNITDLYKQGQLEGSLQLDHLDLSFLQPLLLNNDQLAGSLTSKLRLAGTMNKPQLFGNINLNNVKMTSHLLPITIKQGDLGIDFNGMTSKLMGNIKTSKGELNLNGRADWTKNDAWRAELQAQGQRIRLLMPPVAQLDISPNITLEATNNTLKISGLITVPWAEIKIEQLPSSAVAVSSDEVILDNHLRPITKKNSNIPIESHLRIAIGPAVKIDAFGLKALLNGELQVFQDKGSLGLHGDVNLINGNFHAYGQDLLIEKGQIIFVGPIDQPQLNIRAIRNPDAIEDGVTAGLAITGLADAPKLRIFSEPSMSEEQALSYLLRGQGLDKSNEDSSMMTSALIGLGIAQSGKLVGEIGQLFGIKQLALDTQGVGERSQVVVSGYLLPRLQVKYGIGIFDSLATLTLRYRLLPRLYIEAISGTTQALDLLYQFEFN